MEPGKAPPKPPNPAPAATASRTLWSVLLLYIVYFSALVGLPVYFLSIYGLPALVPVPLAAPSLPLPLAAALGHLRFALIYTLPLTPPALLLLLHTRLTHRPHPTAHPLLYAALLALLLYYLPGLPYPSAYDSQDQRIPVPTVTKPVTLTGARLTTPDLMATLDIAPGAVRNFVPALVTLRSLPHTRPAPGPVPPEATLIAAAEVWRSNPFDDNLANFFNQPAPLRLSLRHAVAPAKNSTHYTEVCSWYGEEGNAYGFKNFWHCQLSDLGPGTDRKGQGYIEVELGGLSDYHQNYYVFQFPKAWANQNCRAAGGRLYSEVDFHSFKDACRGRPNGTRSQIGRLIAPEGPFSEPAPFPQEPTPPQKPAP